MTTTVTILIAVGQFQFSYLNLLCAHIKPSALSHPRKTGKGSFMKHTKECLGLTGGTLLYSWNFRELINFRRSIGRNLRKY